MSKVIVIGGGAAGMMAAIAAAQKGHKVILLEKNENKVHTLVKQDDGDIEYCGEHYKDVIVNMSESEKEDVDGSSAE